MHKPPSVDPKVGRPSEPGIQEVDTSNSVRPTHCLLKCRVVMETEALPEPVDGIWGHVH